MSHDEVDAIMEKQKNKNNKKEKPVKPGHCPVCRKKMITVRLALNDKITGLPAGSKVDICTNHNGVMRFAHH